MLSSELVEPFERKSFSFSKHILIDAVFLLMLRETFKLMKILTVLLSTLVFFVPIFAQKQAQVKVMSTYMRESPDTGSEKVQTLQKGDRLIVQKDRDKDGWLYVSTANGNFKGWVRTDTITSPEKSANIPVKIESVTESRQRVVPTKITRTTAAQTTANRTAVSGSNSATKISGSNSAIKTAASAAETTSEDEEIISVDTEEVNLNVRVIDANNRAVKNLSKDDFEIYEDDVLQPIASLNTTEIPMINALLIDNSRSLRTQLRDIIEAGKIIVIKNRTVDESAVIRFVGANKIDVVQDFTINKTSLIEGLENLYVEGGQTAIIDAVYLAAKKIDEYQKSGQKDDVKLRALILVSDGDDRISTRDEEQLFNLLRNSQVQIYAIGFVNELKDEPDADGINRQKKARAFLKRLSEETGGKVYFPNSLGELPQIAADISTELHTQYLVSYTPTDEKEAGSYRKIKIAVKDDTNSRKRFAIARTGRISAPK